LSLPWVEEEPIVSEANSLRSDVASDEKIMVSPVIEDIPVTMEVDTAAGLSLINQATWDRCKGVRKLMPTKVQISDYNGNKVPVIGESQVWVRHNDQFAELTVVVAKGDRPTVRPELAPGDQAQLAKDPAVPGLFCHSTLHVGRS
jgi:hypothetical protein